jgi:hypothetical protein
MDNAQLIAILKFLVQLKAENLALRKHAQNPEALSQEIDGERQRLEKLPAVAHALARNDPTQLQSVLDTLAIIRPE